MTKEFEFYHGVVFSHLLHGIGDSSVRIQTYPTKSNSSYILNENIGIYIKYCTKRMSPWSFNFLKLHQDEIKEMKQLLDEVYTILVCKDDGIVCLNFQELKLVLDDNHEDMEWVRVSRVPRGKYNVSGKDGKLRFKIGNNEFPKKLGIS